MPSPAFDTAGFGTSKAGGLGIDKGMAGSLPARAVNCLTFINFKESRPGVCWGFQPAGETNMYDKILLATDGSTLSKKAVSSAISLAALTGASLVALKVVPRYPQSYFEGGLALQAAEVGRIEKQWSEEGQAVVDEVKKTAEAQGVKTRALTIKSDVVSDAIIATARKHKCDLIVMASHGRKGVKRLLLGSETQQVLTHSHIPVLVLR
jgi:nucleotide-binding universal stress UspA family protein